MNNAIDQIADMMDDDDSEDQFGTCSPSQLMTGADILSDNFYMMYNKAINKATEMDCSLDTHPLDQEYCLRHQIIDSILHLIGKNRIDPDVQVYGAIPPILRFAGTPEKLQQLMRIRRKVLDELEYEEFLALDDGAKNYIHDKYGYKGANL